MTAATGGARKASIYDRDLQRYTDTVDAMTINSPHAIDVAAQFAEWVAASNAEPFTFDEEDENEFFNDLVAEWVNSTSATTEDYETITELYSHGFIEIADNKTLNNRTAE